MQPGTLSPPLPPCFNRNERLTVVFVSCVVVLLCCLATLNHADSPYIRGIGFLYLRYVAEPKTLWEWFAPYLDDSQEFAPGGDKTVRKTMGEFLRGLISELNYYGTILRRIPVPVQREFKKRLLALELQKARAKQNEKYRHTLKVGSKVICEYSEDGLFYDAVIEECLPGGRFFVTYTAYGNQEEVSIGALKLGDAAKDMKLGTNGAYAAPAGSPASTADDYYGSDDAGGGGGGGGDSKDSKQRSTSSDRTGSAAAAAGGGSGGSGGWRRDRSDSRDRDRYGSSSRRRSNSPDRDRDRRRGRSRSRSRDKSEAELAAEIRKREREEAVATGRDYARRPSSYKTALSLQMTVGTNRKRSRTPPRASNASSNYRRTGSAAAQQVM